jgi:hypothetical protein
MKKITKVIGVTALATGLVGATVPAADAATVYGVHRVTLATSYGSVRVEGFKRSPDYHDMFRTLKSKGDRTPRRMRAVYIKPVGEGGCYGDLWWRRPGPDINLGVNGGWVADRYVTVEVKRHPGCR